jgi:hypothetical protein
MVSDQKESVIFYVKKNPSGFWDVSDEQGHTRYLHLFTNLTDARKYVNNISGNGTSSATLVLK